MLRANEPLLFASIEKARDVIRKIRGNMGERERKWNADKSLYRENGKAGELRFPRGRSEKIEPLEIGGPLKVLVIGDVHCPYHDHRALSIAVKYALKHGCTAVYVNGDTVDFHGISKYCIDPRERDTTEERDVTVSVLDKLAKQFERRWYKCGNHDVRWMKYLFERAPELVRFEELGLRKILHLDDLGFEYVDLMQVAYLGKLLVIHGHEVSLSGIHPAANLYRKVRQSALSSHVHRGDVKNVTHPVSKEITTCRTLGVMSDLHRLYRPFNEWTLGFAIVDINRSGKWQLDAYTLDPATYEVFKA